MAVQGPPESPWRSLFNVLLVGVGVLLVSGGIIGAGAVYFGVVSPTTLRQAVSKVMPTTVPAVVFPTVPPLDENLAPIYPHTPTPQSTVTIEMTPTRTRVASATPLPTATPIVIGASRQHPAPLNTEFRGKKWAFSITNVIRGAEANALIADANMFNDAPADGNEYVLVTVKVTNIATEDKPGDVAWATYIQLTGSRNELYTTASVVEPNQLQGDAFPGGSIEGQITFEVPSDETNLMFVLNESLSNVAPMFVAYDEGASLTPDPAIGMADTQLGLTRNAPASVNDTLVMNPITFTIDEVVRGADAAQMVKDANQFNDPPAEGNEYVCLRLTVKYLGDDNPDSVYSTILANSEFRLMGSQNVLYDVPSVVEPRPQFSDMESNSVYAGGVISGWIVREVPVGEAELLLQYQPQFDFLDMNLRYVALP